MDMSTHIQMSTISHSGFEGGGGLTHQFIFEFAAASIMKRRWITNLLSLLSIVDLTTLGLSISTVTQDFVVLNNEHTMALCA